MSHSAASEGAMPGLLDATAENQVVVTDGVLDIAKTIHLERMMIEAVGRKHFQGVYLWALSEDGTGRKKATTVKYDVDDDGPAHGIPSKLPKEEELVPHEYAKLYLEVGLIIGSEPEKYKPVGLARNKARDEERKKRGVLRRDEGAMRVFIPVTDYIAPQAKFYVGCKEFEGQLYPRLIDASTVFSYPEFWAEVDEKKPLKERRTDLMSACKYHAAVTKTVDEHSEAPIPADEEEKPRNRYLPATTRSNHIVSLIDLTFDAYKQTGDPKFLEKMGSIIENAGLDREWFYATKTESLVAFYDFDIPLTVNYATLMAKELKHALDPSMLMAVHDVLCGEKEGSNGKRGQDLPYSAIPLFFGYVLQFVGSADGAHGFNNAAVLPAVQTALKCVETASQYDRTHPPPTSDKDLELPDADIVLLHSIVKYASGMAKIMEGVMNSIQNSATAEAEQHGAVLKHAIIRELMSNAAETVDADSARSVHDQLRSIEANLNCLDQSQGLIKALCEAREVTIRAQVMVEAYLNMQ
ncbi:hypothetical protein C8A03DRAFT_32679 [Achaetomium macrosporum]|uniref:Uncharacterized protein n=1 Tax=Achaetomium macrosporum TaxID=79813 RepID=A0AAN7HC15_9PEZI|nr:hypothetical protein C8A03DRAFT_32679 [Achaetomium macrosporum]